MNCRVNRSIGKSPRDDKNTDFLSILYNKTLARYKKLNFKVGDRVRFSKNDIPFRKGYKLEFTDEIFEISAISTKNPFNASFNCYPNNSLSSFTNFLPDQIHLKGEWEVAISEISYPSLYQSVTEGKFTFVDGRESFEEKRKIVPMNIEPELYPSFVDLVVAMNNKIRERLGAQVFEYNEIYVSVDKITQKVAVHLPENQSVFISRFVDFGHIFGCDLEQNQTGVIMKGKGPH